MKRPSVSEFPVRLSRLAVPLLAVAATSALLFGSLSPSSQAKSELPQAVPVPSPQRGAGRFIPPSPEGNPTLEDLHFKKIGEKGRKERWLTFSDGIRCEYANNTLTLFDDTKNGVVWRGQGSGVSFVMETTSFFHTLKDKQGRVIWSDAQAQSAPDLTIYKEVKEANGQIRLVNKNQEILWEGPLGGTLNHSRSMRNGNTYHLEMGELIVDGVGGVFTLKNSAGTLLWSGHLPVQPLLVIRDNHKTHYYTANGSGARTDAVDKISLSGETGSVSVRTRDGVLLGVQQADILKITRSTRLIGSPTLLSQDGRTEYKVPLPTLDANAKGTLLLTYNDRTGQSIAHYKVYRDGGAYGFSGTQAK